LIFLQRRADQSFFRFHVVRGNCGQLGFAFCKFGFHTFGFCQRLRQFDFALRRFSFQCSQFALHSQRTCFGGAASADHAALIIRSVRSHKAVRRIIARQNFRGAGRIHQIRRLQARQKLFRGVAQRIAEFHQLIHARNHPLRGREGNYVLFRKQVQLIQRVHEECRSAAEFFTQHGNSGACVFKSFYDDVLQFVSQEIFHGRFVRFRNLGIVGQYSNRAEIATIRRG